MSIKNDEKGLVLSQLDSTTITTVLAPLRSSTDGRVVELHEKLLNMPAESTDKKALMLVGESNRDLVPTAKTIMELSKIVELKPEDALEQALLLLNDEPNLSQARLTMYLLRHYADNGPAGKLFTKLAKEMIEEGWCEKK